MNITTVLTKNGSVCELDTNVRLTISNQMQHIYNYYTYNTVSFTGNELMITVFRSSIPYQNNFYKNQKASVLGPETMAELGRL